MTFAGSSRRPETVVGPDGSRSRGEATEVDLEATLYDPTLREAPTPGTGTVFTPHFEMRGTLGQGGIGRVLQVYDQRIGREVAVKELLPAFDTDPGSARVRRFLREAQVTGSLEHPSIVPVYDVGVQSDGRPYYVMRYIRGRTLGQALRDCTGDCAENALGHRLQYLERLIDVCNAMAYAHARGVIHRDLKPGNVVLGDFGETIILDWGLAKVRGEPGADDSDRESSGGGKEAAGGWDRGDLLTSHDEVLGTPAYMAPEQADPESGAADARTDVFALGCMLYEILVGRPPLRGRIDEILAFLRGGTPMPSAADAPAAVPPELVAICDRALRRDREQRFRDAGELAEQLEAYRDGRLVSAYAYSRTELLRRFAVRNRVPVLAALAVLVAIIAGALISIDYGLAAGRARQEAVAARQRAEQAAGEVAAIAHRSTRLAERTASAIERTLDQLRHDLELTADDWSDRTSLPSDPAGRLAAWPPGLVAGYVAAVGGAPLRWLDLPGRPLPDPPLAQIEACVREAVRTGMPTESPAFSVGNRRVLLVLCQPARGNPPAAIGALVNTTVLARRGFAEDPAAEGYRLWVLQDDGLIINRWQEEEIGRNLFTDSFFDPAPDLRRYGHWIFEEPSGIGVYRYRDRAGHLTADRVGAWETLVFGSGFRWAIVPHRPYHAGFDAVP